MSLNQRIVVVGGGRMGEAVAAGLVRAEIVSAEQLTVVEPLAARHAVFAAHGVACVSDGHEAVADASVVVMAVKPQVIDAVLAHLADDMPEDVLVVSIAAGIPTARLESILKPGTAVVRVMPNTPAMVGEGMAVVSGGRDATSEHLETVRTLFDALGATVVLDERYQDIATAISGSGPAYVALFVDALARAGVRQGLPRDVAQSLAVQTIKGTAVLIERSGMHPEELVDAVSSPGGTTIAGVEALEARGFRAAVGEAVAAACKRARELGA